MQNDQDSRAEGTTGSGESGGSIYTSTDSGEKWTKQGDSGSHNWSSIVSSTDGTMLAAADKGDELGGYIYTSITSGDGWTEQTGSGRRDWRGIASSSNGAKLVAVPEGDYIYTSSLIEP